MPPSDDEFKPVEYSKKPSKSRNKGKGKQRAADNGLEKSIETLLAQKHALLRESGYSQKCKGEYLPVLITSCPFELKPLYRCFP